MNDRTELVRKNAKAVMADLERQNGKISQLETRLEDAHKSIATLNGRIDGLQSWTQQLVSSLGNIGATDGS